MLPPDRVEDASEWLSFLDGLILAGGADYGENPLRDEFEIALGLAALDADLPLLGVCRGMQLMNIARGGTLIEHLPDVVGHEDHRPSRARSATTTCGWPTGRWRRARRERRRSPTKSHHHQGVDQIGDGLRGDRLGGRG